ncbi:hypothetical protein MXF31_11090 [Mammaliicoccus sciuri]|uniref:TOTE conflict system archaeo-eukaryotic primase domain-containing protein n=1 Tax=Mammaliicoccus sciuri TaxID=1296 RepID=UPI002DBF8FE9|nr:hypothetical protein [Mammaliicoccus sciuri]MEB5650187.1 hypothetical protein [Mammaliicoccus sciuri]
MNKLIQKMNELMITNRKHHILMKDNGSYSEISQFLLKDKHILSHLKGDITVGVFSGEQITKYICFDVDTKQHAERDARHLVNVLVDDYNISRDDIHISLSGSKGLHCELYLDRVISYKMAERFYQDVRIKAGFSKSEVELRPQPGQAVKLPAGINRKTGNRCWYVDSYTFKPIENLEHILTIEPMSADYFELEFSELQPITLDEKQAKELTETISSINTNTVDLENTLQYVDDILALGHIKQSGTRNNMTLALAIYLKEHYGAHQEDVTNHIIDIMLTSKNEHGTVSSSEKFIKTETKRIVDVVYKYDYKLIKKNRDVEIYRDEVLDILNIKEKHLKQLYLIHLIQSKRHAKANGHYFITYDTMSNMGATKNRKSLAKYLKVLEDRELIEVVQRKVWDIDRLKTEGKSVYKPNLYKVKKIVTSKGDIDSITIKDNQNLDLDELLKKFADNFNDIDLKTYLPRKQYESVMRVS